MSLVNFGTRNKGTLWGYLSAYSFLHTKHPRTAFEIPFLIEYGEGMPNRHYHNQEEIDAYVKDLFWREFDAGMYTDEFFKRLADVYESDLRKIEETVTGKDFPQYSNDQLAAVCEECLPWASSSLKPMLQGMYLMQIESTFKSMLLETLTQQEKANPEFVREIESVLLTIPWVRFLDTEEMALRLIEARYWNSHAEYADGAFEAFTSEQSAEFQKLAERFGWFHMEYMHEPKSAQEYSEDIRRRLEAGKLDRESPADSREALRMRQEKFFADHPNAQRFKELVRVLHGFSDVYDASKVVTVRANFLIRPLLTEAGKRLELSWSDVLYLTPPEIVSQLRANAHIDPAFIQKRLGHRITVLREGMITVREGDEALQLLRVYEPEEKAQTNPEEVRGIIAYPGKVKGKVIVVNSIRDKDKFSPGDVLVTHDGTAELTLFLKTASAIVTNEGGMICHAAIVAREVKTPAIVGTRFATKVFKDGDMVEVDADHGVVRKI